MAPATAPDPAPAEDGRALEPAPMGSDDASSIDPETLERFVATVERLGAGAMDRSHAASEEALRAFATALAALPMAPVQASDQISATADRLASSDSTSLDHTDMVRNGLEVGLSALTARSPAEQPSDYRDAIQQLRTAIQAIDVEQPLLEEADDVAQAFRAAANLVAVAGNAPAPFTGLQLSAR